MARHPQLARRALRRAALLCSLGVAAVAIAPVSPAAAATTVNFCGPTLYGTYGSYTGVCSRQASFSINWISIDTGGNSALCVYLGTNNNPTPPMEYGYEYCSSAGDLTVYHAYSGRYGNPAAHNRHSYDIYNVQPKYNRA